VSALLVDTHCHLGHIGRPVQEVLDEALEAGVGSVIDVGMGLAEGAEVAARAGASDRVFAAVGIHPNDLSDFESDRAGSIAALEDLAAGPRVVAIGETGLDFYRDRWTREQQEEAFRAHIDLAKRTDLTLVIHCRDAHDAVMNVLDDHGAPTRVVMHCFSGDVAYAKRCAERGYFCSFAGNITYKKNDVLRDAARALPDDLLLVETDAPFLAPVPFRGKPNAPALVMHTAAALAEARSTTVDLLSDLLRTNTNRAFVIQPYDLR
jgi:TatD DNase family protein